MCQTGLTCVIRHRLSLKKIFFKKSLNSCKALVCLSNYLAEFLKSKVDIPVVSVKHPTEIPDKKWSMDNFLSQKEKKLFSLVIGLEL